MKVICFPPKQTWEDQSMRNIAFSILLFALAAMQIAVVFTELPRSHAQTAVARNSEPDARIALASEQAEHEASTF